MCVALADHMVPFARSKISGRWHCLRNGAFEPYVIGIEFLDGNYHAAARACQVGTALAVLEQAAEVGGS